MKEQRITLTIDPHGAITADADGFSGDACLAELDRLLEGVAGPANARTRKRDGFVAKVSTTQTQGKKR